MAMMNSRGSDTEKPKTLGTTTGTSSRNLANVAIAPAANGRWRQPMIPRPASVFAAVLILLAGAAPTPALAQTAPADIATATEGLAKALDLQTEFPGATEDPSSSADWLSYLSIDAARALLWIAVLAGAGGLAYFVRDMLPALGLGSRPRWDAPADGAAGAGGAVIAAARLAADELAAQGCFVEAMHVLLLEGLDEMRMRLDLRFADSLTSREIVTRAEAPLDAKSALRDIIRRVEMAYFGEHPVDRADYDDCRRSFVALGCALGAGDLG